MKSLALWSVVAITAVTYRSSFEGERYWYFVVACGVVGGIVGVIETIRRHRGY